MDFSAINNFLDTNKNRKPNVRPIRVPGGSAPYDGRTPDQGHKPAIDSVLGKELTRVAYSLLSRGISDPKILRKEMLKAFNSLKEAGVISGDSKNVEQLEAQFKKQVLNNPFALNSISSLFKQVSNSIAQQTQITPGQEDQKRRDMSLLAKSEANNQTHRLAA